MTAVLDRKIEDLFAMMLSPSQVGHYLSNDPAAGGLSAEWIRKRAQHVWHEVVARDKEDRPVRKEMMRATLRDHFRWNRERGEAMAATRTLDILCKLDGLYAPVEVKVDTLTDDTARRQRIELLLLTEEPQGERFGDASARAQAEVEADEEPPPN